MTIILPPDYHAQKALENNNIVCISEQEALKRDIRPLRIGILNIMPEAKSYEFLLLNPLGRSVLQISPVWIKLASHTYSSTSRDHLSKLYKTYDEAIKEGPLDGMIVTGAPIEVLPFEEVRYWDEIKELLEECRRSIPSTLGICWGALALSKMIGLEKVNYPEKLFGIFETYTIDDSHRITGGLDDMFWIPLSTHAGIPDQVLEEARDMGEINLLAYSEEAGYPIFETYDHRFLMVTGHFEYNATRLVLEYKRDKAKGRSDVSQPKHLDLNRPLNRWRGQRNEFFAQWIKYCYEEMQNK